MFVKTLIYSFTQSSIILKNNKHLKYSYNKKFKSLDISIDDLRIKLLLLKIPFDQGRIIVQMKYLLRIFILIIHLEKAGLTFLQLKETIY